MLDNTRPAIREYFKNVDPSNIKDTDYETLINVLASVISDLNKK
jgi:hypothetical protein